MSHVHFDLHFLKKCEWAKHYALQGLFDNDIDFVEFTRKLALYDMLWEQG